RAILREAIRIGEENDHRRWVQLFRLEQGWLCVHASAFGRARELGERCLKEAENLGLGYGRLVGPILLGFAHLGVGEPGPALASFEAVAARLSRERLLMGWVWRMPLHLGLGEYRLTQGDSDRARHEAGMLSEAAAASGERTYLALAERLRAEAALAAGEEAEAEAAVERALPWAAGRRPPPAASPLAAWRVYATAARVHRRRGRRGEANAARDRGDGILTELAGFLADDPDLAGALAFARKELAC